MSNRLIWLLIILAFVTIISWFFIYFFVIYKSTLTIVTNIKEYNIDLKAKGSYVKDISLKCEDYSCVINPIAPAIYDLKITKEGYLSFEDEIEIKKDSNEKIEIDLEKEISLEDVSTKINIVENIENRWLDELTNQERIEILRNKNKNYAYFKIVWLWEFFFREENNFLSLYFWKEKLWSFNIVDKSLIQLESIYWDNNFIYTKIWEKNSIIWLNSKIIYDLDLKNIEIRYIKKWLWNSFIIVSDKWSFVFDFKNLKSEYFSYFNDFIYYKDFYIWLITKDDEVRKRNLWLEKEEENLVYLYNPDSKENKILYKTQKKIEKILIIDEEIIIIDENKDVFRLENLD